MIDHDQNEAPTSMSITSLTVIVARAKSDHIEKSISWASASVCASICLLVVSPGFPALLQGRLAHLGTEGHALSVHIAGTGGFLLVGCAGYHWGRRTGRPAVVMHTTVTMARNSTSAPRRTSWPITMRAGRFSATQVATSSWSSSRAGAR